jgi:RNA polymerase sigma-70 factor (ECF subfamily)
LKKQSQSFDKLRMNQNQLLTDLTKSPKNQFFCKFMQHRQSNISVMAETINDEFLVAKPSRSDKPAFDSIIEQYSADVAALANRLLGWPGDVEDVTQEVFLAAFISLKKFRCDCSLKTWLFTITINKCRSYRHKRLLRQKKFTVPNRKASFSLNCGAHSELMDTETFERVRRAVIKLPGKYREAVVLRYLQELPTDQISRILKISKNTLQVRLSRARERLKRELAELME